MASYNNNITQKLLATNLYNIYHSKKEIVIPTGILLCLLQMNQQIDALSQI